MLAGAQEICGPPPQPVSCTIGLVPLGSSVTSVTWPLYCCVMGGVRLKQTLALSPPGDGDGGGGKVWGFGGVASSVVATAKAPPSVSEARSTPVIDDRHVGLIA